MFKNSKIFAVSLLSFAAAASAFTQTAPTAPKTPTAPRIERQMRISTGDGGSYLGVQAQEVTKDNFSKFGLREVRGVAIEKVSENSPAAQAGLQTGDVIIRINGEEVTSARKLTRLISEIASDHQAEVIVLRNGSEKKLIATIAKRPMTEPQQTVLDQLYGLPGIPEFPPNTPKVIPFPRGGIIVPDGDDDDRIFRVFRNDSRQIGVGITPLNKQLGDYFGIADGKGILINNVTENSAAAKAGLKAGDVIVEADGKTVANQIDLIRTINEKKEGEAVTLTIIRNKNRQTIEVTPEERADAPQGFTFQTDGAPNRQQQQRRLQLLMRQPDDPAPKIQNQSAPRVQ